jgi:hypothetical protein
MNTRTEEQPNGELRIVLTSQIVNHLFDCSKRTIELVNGIVDVVNKQIIINKTREFSILWIILYLYNNIYFLPLISWN